MEAATSMERLLMLTQGCGSGDAQQGMDSCTSGLAS